MPESYKEDGRPAQQWYWNDWFSAFDVRNCGLAARGLWIDILGIMWKAEIRGTLTVNGKQPDNKTLANIVGSSVSEIKPLLKELELNNVFSRLDDRTIICRRMFRESAKKDDISKIRSKAGKKGAKKRWQNMAKHGKKNLPLANGNGKTMAKTTGMKDGKDSEEKMAKMAASPSTSPSTSPSNHKKDTKVSFMSASFKNDIIFKWNNLAQKYNLPAIKEITPGSVREKYLRARSAEEDFSFELLINIIENSPFLLGKTKHTFFVFFDWIIKPTNYQKIIEGNYLDRQSFQRFSGIIEGVKELKEKYRKEAGNEP